MYTDVKTRQIQKGDIYFADLSGNRGSEQGGTRPVIILQNNIGNKYSPTVSVAPLTSRTTKKKLPTHINLEADKSGLPKDSVVLVEQIQTLDKSRLNNFLSKVEDCKILHEINNAITIQFGFPVMASQCSCVEYASSMR